MSESNRNESLPDEDSSDDGLWNEFETCATSVTHLYRNSNWRTLQSAAASTTQLYKHGLEMKKRSFDRGFLKGRLALSREISAMCRYKNKIDVADIIALYLNMICYQLLLLEPNNSVEVNNPTSRQQQFHRPNTQLAELNRQSFYFKRCLIHCPTAAIHPLRVLHPIEILALEISFNIKFIVTGNDICILLMGVDLHAVDHLILFQNVSNVCRGI
uniref:Uncharacterized protein n=1 Tax=Meloidogyne enterolobii TaxID=390850 RepID=A0A6V7U2D5_MELEN|nr:unnamed protein product [Meloidogyne enterolobii]